MADGECDTLGRSLASGPDVSLPGVSRCFMACNIQNQATATVRCDPRATVVTLSGATSGCSSTSPLLCDEHAGHHITALHSVATVVLVLRPSTRWGQSDLPHQALQRLLKLAVRAHSNRSVLEHRRLSRSIPELSCPNEDGNLRAAQPLCFVQCSVAPSVTDRGVAAAVD
jgi:hypothetical protein